MNVKNYHIVFLMTFLLLIGNQALSQRSSRFCYKGAKISIKGGGVEFSKPASEVGTSEIIRVAVRPLVNRYGYLVTDEENVILKVSPTNFVEVADLGTGRFRIWAFSYIGRLTAEVGDQLDKSELASFCFELTDNFVAVEVFSEQAFNLQILHHGNADSRLRSAAEDTQELGGVHRFKTVLEDLRAAAASRAYESLLVSAGDNFAAGKDFTAGIRRSRGPYYDVVAQSSFRYDAIGIGEQEFDLGPFVLEKFIRDFGLENPPPFLCANLDFSGEPGLNAMVETGRIQRSIVVQKGEEQIGIIGVTTPEIAFLSSPRNTKALDNLAMIVNSEAEQLIADGINKIVLISHLNNLELELELISMLNGVDVVVAGGDEGAEAIAEPYLLTMEDLSGRTVYLVHTPGKYAYIGQLNLSFDRFGEVVSVEESSGLVRVETDNPDEQLTTEVVLPVTQFVESLPNNIIGGTEVALDAQIESMRSRETNAGNLIADALLWQANFFAPLYGLSSSDIAIQGARSSPTSILVPGLSPLGDSFTFDVLPLPEFVTVVEEVTARQLKGIMEQALSDVETSGEQFAQIAGFRMVYDPAGLPRELDVAGNVIREGSRVISILLNDGRAMVENGEVVEGAPVVRMATTDVLARGGNGYPMPGNAFTSIGVSSQQSLANYLVFQLRGNVLAAQYPEGGEGRIQRLGEGIHWPPPMRLEQSPKMVNEPSVGPNPFVDEITMQYQLEEATHSEIFLLSMDGQALATLYSGIQESGIQRLHMMIPGAKYLPRGPYVIVLRTGNNLQAIKIMH